MLPFPILNQYGNIVVPASEKIIQVAGGLNHVAFVTSKGNLYTRGHNGNGQLGVGDTTVRTTWSKSNTGVAAVYCSGVTTIVKKTDGTWAYCGYGYPAGSTGSVSVWTDCSTAFNSITSNKPGTSILDLKFTYSTTMALRSDNTLWGIGANPRSEIGGSANSSQVGTFRQISISFVPTKIYSGYQCFGASTVDGTFYVSGDFYGALTSGPANNVGFQQYNIGGTTVNKCIDFKGTNTGSIFVVNNTSTNTRSIFVGGQQYFGQLANNVDSSAYITFTSIAAPGSSAPNRLNDGFAYYAQTLISAGGAYFAGINGTSSYIGKGGIGTASNALVYTAISTPINITDYSTVSVVHNYSRTFMLYDGVLYSSGTETTYSKDTSSNVYVKDQPTFL